jgi:VanZ family protein
MNIQQVRLAHILLMAVLVVGGGAVYVWYTSIMHLSLEILNSRTCFLRQRYKMYNFIFCMYSLVLLERLRTLHFSTGVEWLINSTEHLLFGIIICLKVYIYTAIFDKANQATRFTRAAVALVVFNSMGVLNEVFQNYLSHRSPLQLAANSIGDIQMNLLGAAVFMITVWSKIAWCEKRNKIPV